MSDSVGKVSHFYIKLIILYMHIHFEKIRNVYKYILIYDEYEMRLQVVIIFFISVTIHKYLF